MEEGVKKVNFILATFLISQNDAVICVDDVFSAVFVLS